VAVISGFPEFLPQGRLVEAQVIAILRQTFELHGFAEIATRAIEPLSELARKGEITKEVYAVTRLQATPGEPAQWGLHFDLTVPFARYVLDNAGQLSFPFRRYQIQPCWRGERPQEGRYREFWQADIDVVGQPDLAAHHDTEVCLVMLEALQRLHDEIGLPPARLRLNNRKLIQGFYGGLGLADPLGIIQLVDKLPKIGPAGLTELLTQQGLTPAQIDQVMALASIEATTDLADQVDRLGVRSELLDQGLAELTALYQGLASRFPDNVVADLKIARGLDYYTGSVFELELVGLESVGTVCAGGRYDSLATNGRQTFPGVGISLGISRIFAPLIGAGRLTASRAVPSAVLVAVDSPETRGQAEAVAAALRQRQIACEVSPNHDKYGKQIKLADQRGIPYVWFGGLTGQVKDIRSGEQTAADAATWTPPVADLRPAIVRTGDLA